MSSFLLLDVGAGTLDILFYDENAGQHYKAVVRSPVLCVAEQAQNMAGDLLVTGVEMGGGSLLEVLSQHARKAGVIVSASAAMTLSHNPERLRSAGLTIVDDLEAEKSGGSKEFARLFLSDLPRERLESIVSGFGVPFQFDVVGVCAQDHGVSPEGKSHLDFRHEIMKAALEQKPSPETLLYERRNVPSYLNRLKSAADTASGLPCREVYVMDSGMAAILGACMDFQLRGKKRFIVLDVATSHTVCAAIEGGEIAGIVEYHTRDLNLAKLESLLVDLAEGRLVHKRVLAEGGHGAYVRKALGFDAVELIVATGPKRRMVENSKLPIVYGAPLGDNMMTGTTGLLEAIRRRKALEFSLYL
ncbi:MAG: DUF1786 family protein [Deltaproteobacteria bacterium]|jgi:uncharacterized protein (DUF1786 family)|nr:DUF1786 family protein [Deltaproteobacteria bacterium]